MNAQYLLNKKLNNIPVGEANDHIVEAMKEYAKAKCAEQRQIIATGLPDRCFVDMDESWITSFKEPDYT